MSASQGATAKVDSAIQNVIKHLDDLFKEGPLKEVKPYIFDEVRLALNVSEDGSHSAGALFPLAKYFNQTVTPWASKLINDVAIEVGSRRLFHDQPAQRERFLHQLQFCFNLFQSYTHLLSCSIQGSSALSLEVAAELLAPLSFAFTTMRPPAFKHRGGLIKPTQAKYNSVDGMYNALKTAGNAFCLSKSTGLFKISITAETESVEAGLKNVFYNFPRAVNAVHDYYCKFSDNGEDYKRFFASKEIIEALFLVFKENLLVDVFKSAESESPAIELEKLEQALEYFGLATSRMYISSQESYMYIHDKASFKHLATAALQKDVNETALAMYSLATDDSVHFPAQIRLCRCWCSMNMLAMYGIAFTTTNRLCLMSCCAARFVNYVSDQAMADEINQPEISTEFSRNINFSIALSAAETFYEFAARVPDLFAEVDDWGRAFQLYHAHMTARNLFEATVQCISHAEYSSDDLGSYKSISVAMAAMKMVSTASATPAASWAAIWEHFGVPTTPWDALGLKYLMFNSEFKVVNVIDKFMATCPAESSETELEALGLMVIHTVKNLFHGEPIAEGNNNFTYLLLELAEIELPASLAAVVVPSDAKGIKAMHSTAEQVVAVTQSLGVLAASTQSLRLNLFLRKMAVHMKSFKELLDAAENASSKDVERAVKRTEILKVLPCAHLGCTSGSENTRKMCSGCQGVHYCSAECQRKD